MFLLKLDIQDEGHLHANCLFYILFMYSMCLLFHFLSHGIIMHISILTGLQNGDIISWKNGHIWQNSHFYKLNWQGEGQFYTSGFVNILTI